MNTIPEAVNAAMDSIDVCKDEIADKWANYYQHGGGVVLNAAFRSACDEVAELLLARVRELEADEKRLDWLADQSEMQISTGVWGSRKYCWLSTTPHNEFPISLRSAIDAAAHVDHGL